MIGWIVNFLLVSVPLWLWIAIAIAILLALYGVAHLGFRSLVTIGVLLAIGILFPAAAKRGYEAKAKKDWQDAEKAMDRAADARKKAAETGTGHEHWRD